MQKDWVEPETYDPLTIRVDLLSGTIEGDNSILYKEDGTEFHVEIAGGMSTCDSYYSYYDDAPVELIGEKPPASTHHVIKHASPLETALLEAERLQLRRF
jgi:hypothetical protein